MSLIADALTEAVRWAVPVALTGLLGWWAIKRKALSAWREQRTERRDRFDAMLADFPRFRDDMAELKNSTGKVTGQIKRIEGRLDSQDHVLERISAQLWGQMKLDPQARFQCDHTGRNEQVNAAYAAVMRVGEFDLMGFGWKNRVVEEDRPEYERAATQAFMEHRKFERAVRFVRGDGSRFRGLVRIEPYPEDPADLADGRHPLWFGSVVVVEEVQ